MNTFLTRWELEVQAYDSSFFSSETVLDPLKASPVRDVYNVSETPKERVRDTEDGFKTVYEKKVCLDKERNSILFIEVS